MSEQGINVPGGGLATAEAEDLVRVIGLVFSNTFIYGPKHSVTKSAKTDCFTHVSKALEKSSEITFAVSENVLMVNGKPVELKNPLMRMFVTHLGSLDVAGFSLNKGLTLEKFEKLIDVMNTKPDDLKAHGGFADAVKAAGLNEVKVKKVTYQRVEEGDTVVTKEEKDAETIKTAVQSDKNITKETISNVQSILAFLKGGEGKDSEKGEAALRDAASDASRLGDLIMKAAVIKPEVAEVGTGETLGGLVVGCLRRTYEALSKDPSIKTQKGKKALAKTLVLLEKDILQRLRDMSKGFTDADEKDVSSAMEEISDELNMDVLAEEYIRKKKAIEANENRIIRFIKNKGLDKVNDLDLKDRLIAGGLSTDGWRELLVKSGSGGGEGGGGGGIGDADSLKAVGHLALLLNTMEHSVEDAHGKLAGEKGKKMGEILAKVDSEVKQLVDRTKAKITNLVSSLREEEASEDETAKKGEKKKTKPSMPRKELLKILAEIVQELCQPLSVINCSIDMIKSSSLGEVSEQQKGMLDLASQSSDRLQQIIDKLLEISGMPVTLSPDKKIQDSLYRKE